VFQREKNTLTAIVDRAESKDYVDIDALMRLGNISLRTALSAAQNNTDPASTQ